MPQHTCDAPPPASYSNTRPLGRVPSPQVGSGLGLELSLYVLRWVLMVLTNTGVSSLLLWAGANGLRGAL